MNKLEQAARQACQTPLKDLLRSVPKDGRDCYEEDSTCHHFIPYGRLIHEALAEIERLEALAEQAEQEQVCIDWDTKTDEPIMGYAAPVRTKDLTDDELLEISKDAWGRDKLDKGRADHTGFYVDFARAVIAADREKNK